MFVFIYIIYIVITFQRLAQVRWLAFPLENSNFSKPNPFCRNVTGSQT